MTSARWIGTTFPGFFVMANRVVASVSLPHWSVADHTDIYQKVVVAVNDQTVVTAEELYALVRHLPPGTPLTYTLEKEGQRSRATLPSLTFTLQDYFLIFGAYLFTGLTIAVTGIGVWYLKPDAPASRALLMTGLATGLFALTGPDLYGPHWFFRLHVLGEAFFLAGYIHLALVFPVDRVRHHRQLFLLLPYLIPTVLGVAYQLLLYHPAAYSLIHNLGMAYAGVAGAAMLGAVSWDYFTSRAYITRQRIRVILLGFLSGFAFPVILMVVSGVSGGDFAVNYIAFTAFLFPLSLSYAVVKHDLFEIDALLKRGVFYLTLTALLTSIYLLLLVVLNYALHASALTRSPLFPLFFTLAALLLFNPLRDRLQQGVDRLFFRVRYDPKIILAHTSASLATTLRLEEILAFLWRTVSDTLGVRQGGIFLLAPDSEQYLQVWPPTSGEHSLPAAHPVLRAGWRTEGLMVLENGAQGRGMLASAPKHADAGPLPDGAQVLVPLSFKGDLIGLMALGHKESGTFFSAHDRDFLVTLANQGAVSIANALSYQEIQLLNASLEGKVADRTRELARSNAELQQSLARLEQAYGDLQRSQAHLVRAEKMAALGRMTAGIAHEINTPLGASLTSLKLLQHLVAEQREERNQPGATKRTPEQMSAEMDKLVRATQSWMEKAVAYMRSLKSHTRDLRQGEARQFSVQHTIDDTTLLLAHRLRLSQCTLVVSGVADDLTLYGDPGKFGQVLTNLIVNAIDAYPDDTGGEIAITIVGDTHDMEIQVRDHGCGISPEHLDRIFDEFFSTKRLGEGTGLGLSITRDIVANFFGGTISVTSTVGQGSTFLVRLPRDRSREAGQPVVVAPRSTSVHLEHSDVTTSSRKSDTSS
jgi:signal transduction histidine kinase